jgi:tRNA-uridine 2-sulfurtransferase
MVAMSGGVDSSLAAALLQEAGYYVVGANMRLWVGDPSEKQAHSRAPRCCESQLADSAMRVADELCIPAYSLDFSAQFRESVVDYFVIEYCNGRTPNPCIECNRLLKFTALLNRASALGLDAMSTGHYARVRKGHRCWELLRAADPSKDQSYALYMLGQPELERLLFPMGEYSKSTVRQLARSRGLEASTQPDSQDLCFIPDGDRRSFIEAWLGDSISSGPVFDLNGKEVGFHDGLPSYTIGQRRGLRIEGPAKTYVVRIDPARNALIVGPSEALLRTRFVVARVSFVSGEWPLYPFRCTVKVRYRGGEAPATVLPSVDGTAEVRLDEPLRAISPGQSAVFYNREIVLGGGIVQE